MPLCPQRCPPPSSKTTRSSKPSAQVVLTVLRALPTSRRKFPAQNLDSDAACGELCRRPRVPTSDTSQLIRSENGVWPALPSGVYRQATGAGLGYPPERRDLRLRSRVEFADIYIESPLSLNQGHGPVIAPLAFHLKEKTVMVSMHPSHLLFLAALAVTACSEVKTNTGGPPSGTFQGTAAPPMQTESQRMMMQNAPVTRSTPQQPSRY